MGSKTTGTQEDEEINNDKCILEISSSLTTALFGTYYSDPHIFRLTLRLYQEFVVNISPYVHKNSKIPFKSRH